MIIPDASRLIAFLFFILCSFVVQIESEQNQGFLRPPFKARHSSSFPKELAQRISANKNLFPTVDGYQLSQRGSIPLS